MSSNTTQNSSESENTCVVCFKNVEIYSIGVCDHPVCYDCSTRMRVLCKQNECPICRGDMPTVTFTREIKPFTTLRPNPNLQDEKYGVFFCNRTIEDAYYSLLEFNCQVCGRSNFNKFSQLKDHMRREHELFYCDLCVDNLKIFAFERKCYKRFELAQHRRKGDTDNTSHRGHPLCEFCDKRYMDSDDLFRHLRRDHLYCHFCDADGKHQYYPTYEDLRLHFLEDHYLCEEGDCKNEQFTSVFRTDIDLKAHIANVHSRHLSRAANKQARTLEVEFNFGPRRNDPGGQRGGRRMQSQRIVDDMNEGAIGYDNYNMEPGGSSQVFVNPLRDANFPTLGNTSEAPVSSRTSVTFTSKLLPNFNGEEFPTLGGMSTPMPNVTISNQKSKKPEDFPLLGAPRNITITKTNANNVKSSPTSSLQRNFPSLSDSSKSASSTLKLTLNQERPPLSRPNVSIHVNHKSNGAVTTRISTVPTTTVQVRPKSMEAFPALGTASALPVQQWVQPKPKKQHEPKVAKAAPAPVLPPSSLSDFPCLSKKGEVNPKKSSSVTMPVSNNWLNKVETDKGKTKISLSETGKNCKKDKNKKKGNDKTLEISELNKKKIKKNKAKNGEVSASTSLPFENNGDENGSKEKLNGITKKTSTLKIGALEVQENGNLDDFPILGKKPPPPPGISVKPPPGFNFIPKNDLTFTNSSGQSYSILPSHTYCQPANFSSRNSSLIQNFFSVLKTNEAMNEFKSYSDLFRQGGYPAEKYYEHCQLVLDNNFTKIFPELLVLLPDIDKQQALFRVHKQKKNVSADLEECSTCKQVIFTRELKQHLNNHYMENHFPSLGQTMETNNVWKK